jgi:hypothetical protein
VILRDEQGNVLWTSVMTGEGGGVNWAGPDTFVARDIPESPDRLCSESRRRIQQSGISTVSFLGFRATYTIDFIS